MTSFIYKYIFIYFICLEINFFFKYNLSSPFLSGIDCKDEFLEFYAFSCKKRTKTTNSTSLMHSMIFKYVHLVLSLEFTLIVRVRFRVVFISFIIIIELVEFIDFIVEFIVFSSPLSLIIILCHCHSILLHVSLFQTFFQIKLYNGLKA